MGKALLFVFFCFLTIGQVAGQITSAGSGNWDQTSTWVGGIVPVGTAVIIASSHTVTVPNGYNATATNVTVTNAASTNLTIASGGSLSFTGTLQLGSGPPGRGTCTVNGILIVEQGAVMSPAPTGSRLTIGSTGTYRHQYTTSAGTIYTANWQSGSTLEFAGYTTNTSSPSGLGQSFQNLIWNCQAQAADVYFDGSLTTINGNLDVQSTNSSSVFGLTTSANATLTIGGNLSVSSTSFFDFSGGSGNSIVNLAGNLSYNQDDAIGNFGSGAVTLNFNGSSAQSLTTTNTLSTPVNYVVLSAAILDLGTSPLSGTGSLTVNNGGTVRVGSTVAGGAIQNSTTSGNIQTPVVTRSYSAGSTIIYNGASAQTIGSGQPTGAGITTRINNPNGVSLSAPFVFVGTLILDAGNLSIGSNSLTLNGTFTPNSNSIVTTTNSNITIGGTGAFGTLSLSGSTTINSFTLNRTSGGTVTLGSNLTIKNFGTFTHQAGTLILNGNTLTISGDFSQTGGTIQTNSSSSIIIDGSGTLPGSISLGGTDLNTLTIIRSTPAVSMAPSHTITNLNLNDGTLNNTGSITMASGATINVIAGTMTGNAPVGTSYNVAYSNPGALSTGLELPTSTTLLNDLSKSGGGILSLSGPITVNGTMTIGGGFNAGSNAIDLKGNLVTNVNPTFTSNTVTFSGTTALSGSATPIFGNMLITGALNPSINYQVNGNFTNNGSINNGTVTTTFGGTTVVSGSSTTTFNNVSITGTLTAPTTTMNVAGNFSNSGTFNNNGGTIAFTGTSSITGTPNFGNILISGVLNAPTTLNVSRNFTNNGTFNRGTGTVVFNGSSTQSILGSSVTDFNNITITNTAGPPAVQVESNQNLRGVLTLSSNSIFDADGSTNNRIFKLMSSGDSPTVDASIAALPSGAQVTGNVTVQRYMAIEGANSGRIFRFISSPVSSAPVSQIQAFIPVTGPFTGVSSCSGCDPTSPSLYYYDETVITGDFNTGYVRYPTSANTETFATGRGYSIFVRANISPISGAGSALYELSGPIVSGNQSLPVSFTSSGTVANDGWNLVGNPYPSTIDWDAGGWTRTNVNNAIYMRDNGLTTPVYATYVGGVGANGGSRYIAAGQAFFVKSDGGTPVLSLTESVKAAGTQTTFFRDGTIPDLLRVAMRKGSVIDETVIRFASNATSGFDPLWDAYKLKNATFNLSSLLSDNKQLIINSQPLLSCDAEIKLDVSNAASGSYNLDFSGMDSFIDQDRNILLVDSFTGQTINVRNQSSYAFQVTSDSQSFGSERFKIVLPGGNINTNLSLQSTDVCIEPTSSIKIDNSQSSVSYYVVLNGVQVSNTASGNGSQLTLNLPSDKLLVGSNSIKVMATFQGCNPVQMTQSLIVKKDPDVAIASVQNAKRCQSGSVTLSATGPSSTSSYRWYESENSTTSIAGQTSSQFVTPSLSKTKTYFVSAVNSLGCEGSRVPVVAEVNAYDNVTVTESGGKLVSSYSSGNQWYKNGQPIDGATSQSYEPAESGVYKVVSTVGSCTTSAEREFVVTDLAEEATPPDYITITPNPTKDVLFIHVKSTNEVGVQLVSLTGSILYELKLSGTGVKKAAINLQEYASGLYVLLVQDDSKVYRKRIIKNQ